MPIENIGEIEQSLGIEAGKLTEWISSEDNHKVELENLVIKPKADYDTLINNLKKESGSAALEIAIKEQRKKLGLEFEGKTMDNLLSSFQKKVETEAKIDPNKKYDTLKSDFEKLQGIASDWESKYSNLETNLNQERQQRKIDSDILSKLPDNLVMSKEDMLVILKAKNQIKIGEDGYEIIGQDGKPMKNQSNMNNLTLDEFLPAFTKPYIKPVSDGAGDDDDETIKPGSFEAFEKEMESKNATSEQFNEELQKRIANKTLVM